MSTVSNRSEEDYGGTENKDLGKDNPLCQWETCKNGALPRKKVGFNRGPKRQIIDYIGRPHPVPSRGDQDKGFVGPVKKDEGLLGPDNVVHKAIYDVLVVDKDSVHWVYIEEGAAKSDFEEFPTDMANVYIGWHKVAELGVAKLEGGSWNFCPCNGTALDIKDFYVLALIIKKMK